jgi:sRNA-binding carbon storage regulator CsrA
MLILSMRTGDDVIITVPPGYRGGELVVTFLGLSAGHPRIGFTADKSIVIDREKVHKRKIAEAKGEPAL